MKKILFPATALILALTGCAAGKAPTAQDTPTPAASQEQPVEPIKTQPQQITVDSAKTVVYTCSADNTKEKVAMQYGIKNNELAVAIANFRNQTSPILMRNTQDTEHNTFVGGGVVWSSSKATVANVDKTNGGGLALIDGNNQLHVVANNCSVDKAATAAANKTQAAQAPAKAAAKGKSKGKTRR